jgi:hypothetical protein
MISEKMKILTNALERQELSALSIVDKYSASLGLVLGEKAFEEFEVRLKNLDFKQALALLNATDWTFGEAQS